MNRETFILSSADETPLDVAISTASAIGYDVGYLAALEDVRDLARTREFSGSHFTSADATALADAALLDSDEVQG